MVKIITASGDRDKFDSKDVEKDLEAMGFPRRVSEDISERVEDKVQDGWTTTQVKEEIDLQINRMHEDFDRAYKNYKNSALYAGESEKHNHRSTIIEKESEQRSNLESKPVEEKMANKSEMTAQETGKMGDEKVKEEKGAKFYSRIGHKGRETRGRTTESSRRNSRMTGHIHRGRHRKGEMTVAEAGKKGGEARAKESKKE